jgi:PAS domain S-box-containing protein
MPEIVWKADEHGTVFFISEKIEKVFGYTRAEIYSEGEQLWFERMHPDDRERYRRQPATAGFSGRDTTSIFYVCT